MRLPAAYRDRTRSPLSDPDPDSTASNGPPTSGRHCAGARNPPGQRDASSTGILRPLPSPHDPPAGSAGLPTGISRECETRAMASSLSGPCRRTRQARSGEGRPVREPIRNHGARRDAWITVTDSAVRPRSSSACCPSSHAGWDRRSPTCIARERETRPHSAALCERARTLSRTADGAPAGKPTSGRHRTPLGTRMASTPRARAALVTLAALQHDPPRRRR